MKHFEFLPHTADIRMHVEASSPAELFEAALQGMNTILDTSPNKGAGTAEMEYTCQLTSPDLTALLIDFLSDVLTASYESKAIFDTLHIHALTETTLRAIVRGYSVGQFDEDIKAVTYHEAEVIRNAKGNWETIVIFDI